ncbi:MAG: hypothetical protein JJU00_08200 [Opitutales bacterium]|nr:hypothetical protein [Opitutales bacterium]
MLTELSWRQLPPPDTRAVDPACLPAPEAFWSCINGSLRRLSGIHFTAVEWRDDLTVRIRASEIGSGPLVVSPWPDASVVLEGRDGIDHVSWADGCILSPALEQALPTRKDMDRASDPYDYPQSDVLADLGINGDFGARLRSFSETFPSTVLEAVARWRFTEGRFSLAAACAVAGFQTLLAAHPQLAWLVADRMLRENGQRGIRGSDWDSVVKMGPLWLAVHFLRLPRRRGTLTVLRRLHMDCLRLRLDGFRPHTPFRTGSDILSRLQNVFGRKETFETLMRLETPISNDILDFLMHDIVPHLDLLRELQQPAWPCGDPRVRELKMDFAMLLEEVRAGRLAPVALGGIRSPRRLRRMGQALRERAEREVLRNYPISVDTGLPFPFPASANLVPLTSCAEIRDAGERLRNCLAGLKSVCAYIPAILAGNGAFAVFRKGPEEALVYFSRSDANEAWAVYEASGDGNTPPSEPLVNALNEWCLLHGVRGLC